MSTEHGSSGETSAPEPNAFAAPASPVAPTAGTYSAPPAPSGYEAVPQTASTPAPPAYGAAAPTYGQPAADPYGQQQPASPYGAQPTQAYGQQPGAQAYGAPQATPYGAQPQYGAYGAAAPAYGQQYGGAQKTDGLAIASLVTSILGFSAIALGLGIAALRRIKRSGAAGRGMAIAGIVISSLTIVGILLVVLFTVVLGASGALDDIDTGDTTGTWDEPLDDTADGSTDGDLYKDPDDTVLPDYTLVTGLQPGECLTYSGTYDLSGADSIDCALTHDMEIVALVPMSGPVELSLSADDPVWYEASTSCEQLVEAAAPGLQDSTGWADLYYPHPDQYAAGETTAYCTFTSYGTDLTGSIAAGTLSVAGTGA
ncbi:DUF4190 domain-containing protein [Cellulomonas soli]|uniref:DUF4190 domain-containing protein n=1 Tax=Cellulomonas soli TaxID=931535 RepID=UPI003F83BAA5